jgi:hypothetical protein
MDRHVKPGTEGDGHAPAPPNRTVGPQIIALEEEGEYPIANRELPSIMGRENAVPGIQCDPDFYTWIFLGGYWILRRAIAGLTRRSSSAA